MVQDARSVVATWSAEFAKAPNLQKRLAMVFVANDILQNSRKKGPQFVNEFHPILPGALQHLVKHGDDKVQYSAPFCCQAIDLQPYDLCQITQ